MTDSQEQIKKAEEQRLERASKRHKRRVKIRQEMQAASVLGRVFIFLKYLWFDLVVFLGTFIVFMGIMGVVGRIIWELWKAAFSINL